jgi:hypothetical protein
MVCCGKERATQYCPDCGTCLDQSPLYTLLVHCKQRLQNLEALEARRVGRTKAETIKKWRAWTDAVEKAIEAAKSK